VGLKYLLLGGMSFLDVMMARYLISFLVDFLVMNFNEKKVYKELDTPKKKWLAALRAVIFLLAFVCFIWSLSLIPTVFVGLI